MEKPKINLPIIVEGKYDKNTLSQVFDAHIVTLGGFSIFNSKEKQAFVRRLAKDGIIVMTDSDGGGRQIRSFLLGILPPEKVKNVYIPPMPGKEKRKRAPSKAGLLGVEGMTPEVLKKVLSPFTDDGGREKLNCRKSEKEVTNLDLYNDGISGRDGSSERRAALCRLLDLPHDLTPKALVEAINMLVGYTEYKAALLKLDGEIE